MLPHIRNFVQSEVHNFDCQRFKLSNEAKSLSAAVSLTQLDFLWEVLELAQYMNTT